MNSEPPPAPAPIRWLVELLESLIDWIIDLVHRGKWSTLLLLIAATAISLLTPEKGFAYEWLSNLLPEQYRIFFAIGITLIILLAFLIRFFGLDQPISRSWAIFLASLTATAFVFAIFTFFQSSTISTLYPLDDKLSWGEEFLTAKRSKCKSGRENATVNFREPNYKVAEGFYSEYIRNCSYEPEAQIYLSNTRALQTNNFMRIVVSVPISRPKGTADSEEILRGVALAQNEWNAKKENRKLLVGIADDGYGYREEGDGNCGKDGNSGECGKARETATRLVKQSSILGVIGHFSSDATEAAANVYEGKLVVISPTSTAVRINSVPCLQDATRDAICLNSYVFRTASNDSIAVNRLINKKNLPSAIRKIALVYEGKNTYSRLFKKIFSKRFEEEVGAGSIVNPQSDLENRCNFSISIGFTPAACLEASRQADALLLVPSTKNASDVKDILDLNYKSTSRLALLGADSMYKYPFIRDENKQAKTAAEGMLIVVPWHRSDDKCIGDPNRLECKAAKLFGDLEPPPTSNDLQGKFPLQISWRTATAFDATQALIKSLVQTFDQKCRFNILNSDQCVRAKLKDTLLNSNFEAEGALGNGKIRFDNKGDRVDDGEIAVIVEAREGEFKKRS